MIIAQGTEAKAAQAQANQAIVHHNKPHTNGVLAGKAHQIATVDNQAQTPETIQVAKVQTFLILALQSISTSLNSLFLSAIIIILFISSLLSHFKSTLTYKAISSQGSFGLYLRIVACQS
jgi:hypothetical protein